MCFEWLDLYLDCVWGCFAVFSMCFGGVWGGVFEYICVSAILLSNTLETYLKHT